MLPTPHVMALSSALCAASATILIQRGLRGSTFYAGAWINVVVGVIAAWAALAPLPNFFVVLVPLLTALTAFTVLQRVRRSLQETRT